ncbi:unnamed protein product [Arctia plantaginis]|uniref:Uncharacterized protein n=1 Tax=Arctia plantaginis TaxID=874455 RepID=A0A8S0YTE7_ARCPL|nr:unnamed protein product [Arctia plantaginis]
MQTPAPYPSKKLSGKSIKKVRRGEVMMQRVISLTVALHNYKAVCSINIAGQRNVRDKLVNQISMEAKPRIHKVVTTAAQMSAAGVFPQSPTRLFRSTARRYHF